MRRHRMSEKSAGVMPLEGGAAPRTATASNGTIRPSILLMPATFQSNWSGRPSRSTAAAWLLTAVRRQQHLRVVRPEPQRAGHRAAVDRTIRLAGQLQRVAVVRRRVDDDEAAGVLPVVYVGVRMVAV